MKSRPKNKKNLGISLALAVVVIYSFFIGDLDTIRSIEKSLGSNGSITNSLEDFRNLIFHDKYQVKEASDYYEILDEDPNFSKEDLENKSTYLKFSPLDNLNRVGVADALLGPDTLASKKREYIGHVKPTGWKQKKYSFIDGGALYNRCHLIGHQLCGEDDNWQNLMTGTRAFNTEGMLPFENAVANYIKDEGKKVRYRVSPIFKDDELVARGVIMEVYSIEDNGRAINFKVYVKNFQKGVKIDYKTGRNYLYK